MTAHVLESLEELDRVSFASACEDLWGNGATDAGGSEGKLDSTATGAEVHARQHVISTQQLLKYLRLSLSPAAGCRAASLMRP